MKKIEEIYQELLAIFAERAGFEPEPGCDLAVRLWAVAAQLQALGIQADWVLNQSFPQTAQGMYLDYQGQMRGLIRLPATKAAGTLRFSVDMAPVSDVVIPAETTCMTEDEIRFQTTAAVTLIAGTLSVDAPAEALEGGKSGNAASGTINILTACPMAVTGCTNPAAFSGGSDEEDDETFRRRILESYQRLPNGANAAWYEQTAMNYGGVAAARAVGRARGIGTVDVYVATEQGLPGEDLLTGLQTELQAKREIAVDVTVKAPSVQNVDMAIAVTPKNGMPFEEVKAEVEQSVASFFSGKLLGQPVRLADLGSMIYALNGVENYRISAPTADVAADSTVLPILGTLTVTEMEE